MQKKVPNHPGTFHRDYGLTCGIDWQSTHWKEPAYLEIMNEAKVSSTHQPHVPELILSNISSTYDNCVRCYARSRGYRHEEPLVYREAESMHSYIVLRILIVEGRDALDITFHLGASKMSGK